MELERKIEDLVEHTVYDPIKSTLWVSGADGKLVRIDREPDPNAVQVEEEEEVPKSVKHSMVNTLLVVICAASFVIMIIASGIPSLFL